LAYVRTYVKIGGACLEPKTSANNNLLLSDHQPTCQVDTLGKLCL